MAKINTCPAGHLLQPWSAAAGCCDGCRKLVKNGDSVMDCRQCNWYLCEDCHPPAGTQPTTFWGTMSSLFDVSCQVPTVQVTGSEIIIDTAPKKASAGAASGIARQVEAPVVVAYTAASDVQSESISRAEGTGSAGVQRAERSHNKVEVRQAEEKQERQQQPAAQPAPQPAVPVVDLLDLDAEEVVTSAAADLMSLQIDTKANPAAPPAVNAARLGA